MADTIHGQCLCGGVSFEAKEIGPMNACHCRMCQRWTGSLFVDVPVQKTDLAFTSEASLVWYDSSDWAQRGFCGTCGSSLFYRLKADDSHWAVLAGTLDLPQGLALTEEIFIDEKPDYYDLAGDRPRLTGAEVLAKFQESQK